MSRNIKLRHCQDFRIVGKPEVAGDFPDPPGPRSLSNRFVVHPAIPFCLRSDLHSRWPTHVRSTPRRPSLPSPPPTCVGAADCLRRTPRDSSGVPLKLSGAHNAAFSSSLFLVGITLTRILFWSIRATINITVRSPRSGISSMNIRPLVRN